jgi:hypothetical protein
LIRWQNPNECLYGPFDLVVRLQKSKKRLDSAISLGREHIHNHSLFFNVLCDDFTGDGEAFGQSECCLRAIHFGEFLRRIDSGAILASRLSESLGQFFYRCF